MSKLYRRRLFLACMANCLTIIAVWVAIDSAHLMVKRLSPKPAAPTADAQVQMVSAKLAQVENQAREEIAKLTAEKEEFQKRYLYEYDRYKTTKSNFDRATRIIERLRARYDVPTQDILNYQICTCDNGQPCWNGNKCDFPSCPVCGKKPDDEESAK